MAERYAILNGNWSSTLTWDGATTLPQSTDDVYANNKAVTIDQDVTVLSVRTTAGTTAVAGGGFTLNDTRVLTVTGTGVLAGSTDCVTFSAASPATATITGNVAGSAATANADGVVHSGTGTLTINGNCTGGAATTAHAVNVTGNGVLNLNGNATGAGVFSNGVKLAGANTFTMVGDSSGGSGGGTAYGVNQSGGTCTMSVTGTTNGNATVGTAAISIANSTTLTYSGTLNVTTNGGSCIRMLQQNCKIILDQNIPVASDGTLAIGYGAILIHATNAMTQAYRVNNGGSAGAERTLGAPLPAAGDVRNGTATGLSTGTLDLPAEASVKTGVTFDGASKTGTYTGSDRWTDPGESNVRSGTAYKANSTSNNKTGTLDIAADNTAVPQSMGIGM